MLYRNYIKVEPDFIPVFTSDSYRTHPDKWKSYYPHESFKKINNFGYTAVLVREKTFASFVIKHIFEDNLDEVEKYFSYYELGSL